jgi:hypothetical protein
MASRGTSILGDTGKRIFGGAWIEGITTVVVGVWFYFIGWVYSYFFFGFFHVSVFEIDMPIQAVMIQATTPIVYFVRYYYPVGIILPAFLILIFVLNGPHRGLRKFINCYKQSCLAILFLFALGVFFFGGFELSKVAADWEARKVWISEAPAIYFSFEQNKAEQTKQANQPDTKTTATTDSLMEFNKSFSLRLLLATKDYYYVFVRNPNQNVHRYLPDGWLFKIPGRTVRYASTRRRGGSINESK